MKRNNFLKVSIIVIFSFVLCGCGLKNWPLNENTDLVPEPTFKRVQYIKDFDKKTIAIYTNVSVKEGYNYVSQLQNEGFDEDLTFKEILGNYYFKATNPETNITVTYNRIPTGMVYVKCKHNKK